MKIETSQIEELKLDRKNPRHHSADQLDVIKHSLETYGGGRSILIDDDGNVIAGNATTLAAIESGAIKRLVKVPGDKETLIAVVRDDLTDDEKRRLSVMDNRATDLSGWETENLIEILNDAESVGFLEDTGFDDADLSAMLDNINATETGAQASDESVELEDTPSELDGVFQVKEFMSFKSECIHEFPELRLDRCAALPESISAWAGRGVDIDDGETYWIYNFGSGRSRDIPYQRTILAFYIYDRYFEAWWGETLPEQIERVIKLQIPIVITPNFSTWADDPVAVHIWQIYRNRYVGRFLQEAGVNIIPDVDWLPEKSWPFGFAGIPKYCPAISVQVQTSRQADIDGQLVPGINEAIKVIQPNQLLLYGASVGNQIIDAIDMDAENIRCIETSTMKRANVKIATQKGRREEIHVP